MLTFIICAFCEQLQLTVRTLPRLGRSCATICIPYLVDLITLPDVFTVHILHAYNETRCCEKSPIL